MHVRWIGKYVISVMYSIWYMCNDGYDVLIELMVF
ncbi:hypothetical protein BvCmsKSP068_00288 [Escherichia coli]|nr:hypothetical protein BvCmsKSP068_00288 [Escherichia coli]